MKQSKKEILLEILRFLIVGGIATLCDYAVFYLFKNVVFQKSENGWLLAVSTALGFLTGLIVNWVLQKFVYRYISDEQAKSKKLFLEYFILSLAGLGITELGILLGKPLYNTVTWHIIIDFDFWQLFFKCMMTGIVLVINYLGRKFWIFRQKNEGEKTEEN